MRPRRGRRAGLIAALVVGVATVPATAVSARPTRRVVTPPTVVSHATTKTHALPAPGLQTIESITLPPGTWSIFAKATAIDPSGGDFFRCVLTTTKPTTQLDGSTSQLNPSVSRDVITNVAVFTAKRDVTVRQECGHDGDAGDSGSIDAGASLVAFASAPSRVRNAYTTGQTALPKATDVGVENISLPKGRWVVALKISQVDLSDPHANVSCQFGATTRNRQIGNGAGYHAVSTELTVLLTPKLTSTTTMTLTCESDSDAAYLDPNTVVWAWRADDAKLKTTEFANTCPLTIKGVAANDALVVEPVDCDMNVGSYPSQLVGAHLTAGTWVVIGADDQLWFQSPNLVRCQILNANRGNQLDTTSAASSTTFVTSSQLTNLATVSVAKSLDVEGRCGQDQAGDPSRALKDTWVFIKP